MSRKFLKVVRAGLAVGTLFAFTAQAADNCRYFEERRGSQWCWGYFCDEPDGNEVQCVDDDGGGGGEGCWGGYCWDWWYF